MKKTQKTDKQIKIELNGEHKKAKISMPKWVYIMSLIIMTVASIVIFCVRLSCGSDSIQCQTVPYSEKK